jgi:signal transduction histidine kinase
MNRWRNIKRKWGLTISLAFFVFAVLIVMFLLAGLILAVLNHLGVPLLQNIHQIQQVENTGSFRRWLPLLGTAVFCIMLGTALTFFFSKTALNPLRKLIAAIHKVARGDFDVQVELKGIGELEELSQSFNTMTRELSSIETLRSDFVNYFSHEFKTPIVSICGFAKLLKNGNINAEERLEYLDIIIDESERLAELSANVLNMSKYENILIIQNKSPFRLDEQIRRAILMMEPKWSRKEVSVDVEMDEIYYNGNEDFMQQIWINLLDNAIKFSYPGGLVGVSLTSANNGVRFSVQDDGAGMDEQTKTRIFDKFYQGNATQKIAGNGLGLAIAKQITDLCGGTIEVQSELGKGSKFTVFLPNES